VKKQYKDSEFSLTINEIQILINACDNMRDRMIVESLYYPALRRFEVCDLCIENIDFNRGRIEVLGKGNKLSPIPVGSLYPQYIANLKHFIGNKRMGFIFLSNRGRKLEISRINQILAKIGEKANIKNPNPHKKHINPHIFRHSQARHLKNRRFQIEFVQKYLRHTKRETTADTYGTLSIDEMENLAIENDQVNTQRMLR